MNRKTSDIWSHFTVIENTTFAKCNICKKKYSFKTSVTNLKTHYFSSHWIQINTAKQSNEEIIDNPGQSASDQFPASSLNISNPPPSTSIQNPTASTSYDNSPPSTSNQNPIVNIRKRKQTNISEYVPRKMTFETQKKIDDALIKMITKDFQPFKIVEDEGFRHFVHLLNPSYKIPNRHTLSKVHIPALYQRCLNETKEMIKTEAECGCITTDCWTSRSNMGYITITFHFIDTNFSLKSVLLGCHEFSESHTGLNLSNKIKLTLEEWNLEKKICFAVSDNANNIQNALSNLKIKHFGCFAHTLNLIVQGALKIESNLIEKIKTIVAHFRKSTSANKKLNNYQISNGAKEPKKLLQDVSTRWNSTLYMIERMVELENSIRGTLGLLDNPPEGLNAEEWKVTRELCIVLRPFEEATRAVSGGKYMTASMVIILSEGLKNVCNQLQKENYHSRVHNVVSKLLSGMQDRNRWGYIIGSKTLGHCTFLDPRFKNIPFTGNLLQTIKSDIIEKTASIISDNRDNEVQLTPIATSSENEKGFSIWSSIDLKVAQIQPTGTNTSRAIIEVQRYLEDDIQKRNTDALKWWRDNKYNYPYLSRLARKTLCCLGTSVPCERVFLKAGLLISDRRSRLSSNKVEMLLFLNQNT
ncbi:hypothetical protein QTP88_001537 [Uroleucon formosanum]